MDEDELRRVAETLLWDYRYDIGEAVEVLRGRRERVGHLDRQALFARMLQTMPWQRIVGALTLAEVERLLTAQVIERLWPKSLQERYERIRRMVRGDSVPPAEWSAENARRLRSTVLSDRWYRAS